MAQRDLSSTEGKSVLLNNMINVSNLSIWLVNLKKCWTFALFAFQTVKWLFKCLHSALWVNAFDPSPFFCPRKFNLHSLMYFSLDFSEPSLSIIPSILSCLPLNWTCFISFIPAVGSQCWGITFISVSFIARWVQSIYLMRESWRYCTEKPTAPLPYHHFTSVTQLMQIKNSNLFIGIVLFGSLQRSSGTVLHLLWSVLFDRNLQQAFLPLRLLISYSEEAERAASRPCGQLSESSGINRSQYISSRL